MKSGDKREQRRAGLNPNLIVNRKSPNFSQESKLGNSDTERMQMTPMHRTSSHSNFTSQSSTNAGVTLAWLWLTWASLTLMLALLNVGPSTIRNTFSVVAILLHMLLVLLIVSFFLPKKLALVLSVSLALRTILMFWDLHLRDTFPVPLSGVDTEYFFNQAVLVAGEPALVLDSAQGNVFSKGFGLLLWLVGPARDFAQYTNVLFGISIIIVLISILSDFDLADRQLTCLVTIAALFPTGIILSAVFLREAVITLLVTISVSFFVRWFLRGGIGYVVGAFASILIAATLHGGVIVVAGGYALVAILYHRPRKAFVFTASSAVFAAILCAVFFVIFSRYPDLFLEKLTRYDSENDLLAAANLRSGDAAYLTSLAGDSPWDLIRYGPIRAFYFLASPLPWDIRGIPDLVALTSDSIVYVGTFVFAWKRRRALQGEHRVLAIGLVIVIIGAALLFGVGVSNSGTALRHRYKFFILFIALLATMMSADNQKVRQSAAESPLVRHP